MSVLLTILLACGDKSADTASTTDVAELTVSNVSVFASDCGMASLEDAFTTTVDAGVVKVLHDYYEYSSCVFFDVSATLEDTTITVDYIPTGEECNCIDRYQLNYHLNGLTAGTYTINAPGDVSSSVTID